MFTQAPPCVAQGASTLMGSLQDELKKLESPEPVVQTKPLPKIEPRQEQPSIEGWKLPEYAATVSRLCEELELSLSHLSAGLDQYRLLDPTESALKPGRNLKDFKGSVKELFAKAVNARRIATSVKSELSGT